VKRIFISVLFSGPCFVPVGRLEHAAWFLILPLPLPFLKH